MLYYICYYHFIYMTEFSNKTKNNHLKFYVAETYLKHVFCFLNVKIVATCLKQKFMTKKKKCWKVVLCLFNSTILLKYKNVVIFSCYITTCYNTKIKRFPYLLDVRKTYCFTFGERAILNSLNKKYNFCNVKVFVIKRVRI